MYIRETYVNKTEGYQWGDSDWYETFTDNLGKLFHSLKKEYGNASNMYRDNDGPPKKVGWVFTGRTQYEDTGESYLREVWVEVSTTEPSEVSEVVNVTHPF